MLFSSRLFKQAYYICRDYKFLWVYGLFLALGQMLNVGANWNPDNFNLSKLSVVWQNIILLASFGLLFLLIFIYFRSKAGFIFAVKNIADKQPVELKTSFASGRLFYSRLLSLSVLIQVGLLILSVVLSSPVYYLLGQKLIGRATMLGILGGIIFVPVAVTAIIVGILAAMFVVMFDMSLRDAARQSFDLFNQYWIQLAGLVIIFFIIAFAPFVILAFFPYDTHGFGVLAASLIAVFIIEIAVVVYQQTFWVLAFQELIKPQKLEEEEVGVLPEVIS